MRTKDEHMEECMTPDSPLGQVISLSSKRLVQDVPAPGGGEPVLRDVLAGAPFDAAVTGFVLACLPPGNAPVMWVSDRLSRRENGRLYGPALAARGLKAPVLRVEVSHPRDVLWAMEEGAGCAGLGAVVGEIHGAPEVLSFTATKRLALRSEAAGVPVWLIRTGEEGSLSAARERWRLSSLPSARHPWNAQAPGTPLWEAELFRARGRAPGTWSASHDPAARRPQDRLRLVPRSGDGPLAQDRAPTADLARG
jgi:protein ImuA